MKRKKLSITWVVFGSIVLFSVVLLGILWYFQILHLNDFYENAKRRELSDAAAITYELYTEGTLNTEINKIANDYDIGIAVIESDGTVSMQNTSDFGTIGGQVGREMYDRLYAEARLNGGTAFYEMDGQSMGFFREGNGERGTFTMEIQTGNEPAELVTNGAVSPQNGGNKNEGHYNPRESLTEAKSVIYIRIVNDSDGNECLLTISTLITPLDATAYTLRQQFIYITVFFVIAAIALGVAISIIVSRPIVKINDSAKELAQGDFDVQFTGTGYREVQELSETLNYAARELGRTEGLRRELIANVSHDLRTPLTMITAYSEVMRDLPGECTPENAQVIIEESKRLTTLVNDMLDLSKLQAGVMQLELSTYDFTKNIIGVMHRFARLKEQDGYDIRFEYQEDVRVTADEYKIYQVVYNLIINAINYAGEDKQVVVRQIVNGNIVRIEVEDHGRGIAKEELDNIWDRYYKVDKNHKRAVQGTGLGLSIVNNILKLHGAKFGVRSTVGRGSTFWFELHIAEDDEELTEEE